MTPAVFDIAVVLIIFLSTALACWRGFVKELFTIVGLGVSALAAWKGGHLLVPIFNDWLGVKADGGSRAAEAVSRADRADAPADSVVAAAHAKSELILGILSPELAAKLLAYGGAFFGMMILMSLVSFFITRSIQEMGLGFVDRMAGAVFGFVRGFLMVFLPYVVCFIVAGKSTENFPDWATNSRSVPVLDDIYEWADARVDIGKFVQDHGDSLSLKLDKKSLTRKTAAERELDEALTREEAERAPPP